MAEATSPRKLSREQVIGAARSLVEREGVEGLTMRRLAAECGVGVMTLYGYVRDKDALLEAIGESAAGPTPEREGETLDRIVDRAIELVDRDGVDALTMRRLAEECGMGTMTLYRYVRTKEDMLTAVADRVLSDLPLPSNERAEWSDQLVELFSSFHRVLSASPALAQIALRQRVVGASWTPRAELVMSLLRDSGLGDAEAVAAADALVSFTTGFTLRQLTPPGGELPADEAPTLTALGSAFRERGGEQNFETGLRMLIAGIAATAAA